MPQTKVNFLGALLSAFIALPLFATTITFDDLDGSGSQTVPNGYNGLNWNNFYTYDAVNDPGNLSPSGYDVAAISPNNVAFNGNGNTALFSNTLFDLNSAYLTSIWRDNLQVEVIGSFMSLPLYDNVYTLSATSATLINFNYVGVDSVSFSIFAGGTHHPGYDAFDGPVFAIDNVVINETPVTPPPGNGVPDSGSTALLLAASFFGVSCLRAKLIRAAN